MKKQWGRRHFDSKTMELCLAPDEPGEYPLDLEDCSTSERVLDVIAQVADKNLVTNEDLGQLVRALDELIDLQGALCGGALNGHPGKTIDAKAVIASRIAK